MISQTSRAFGRCRVVVGNQLVSSTWFAQGGNVNETYEWDVDPEEYEDEGPEWVEDADANHGR